MKAVITELLEGEGGNPSSVHLAGRAARARVELARKQVARLVNASPGDVIFTSGGTEANNLALGQSFFQSIIISPIEHDSVRGVVEKFSLPVTELAIDEAGIIDLAALKQTLESAPAPALVSIMLANNETGVIEPVAEAAQLARKAGAIFHTDAIQAAGKIPLDMTELEVDMMSLSGHKIGAPAGVGALVLREGFTIEAVLQGGGQEQGRRSGTENLIGIIGMGAAAEAALGALNDYQKLKELRDTLEDEIMKIAPEVIIFSRGAERLVNTTKIALPGVAAETQVMAFDLEGFAVSSGSACSSGKVTTSHVLQAMKAGDNASTAIRISLGPGTTRGEIDKFIAVWGQFYQRIKNNPQRANG